MMKTRRFRALDTLQLPSGDYVPNYVPTNVYKVNMTDAEKAAKDKDSRWMEDLRRMVQIGGGKVIVKEEKGDNAVITVNHPWGHNMGNLSIPKSALKKAQFQLVKPWTDASGNPVEPDKMQVQPLRRRRDYGEIEGEIAKRMKEAAMKLDINKDAEEIARMVVEQDTPFMLTVSGSSEFIGLYGSYQEAKTIARKMERETSVIPYLSRATDVPKIKTHVFRLLDERRESRIASRIAAGWNDNIENDVWNVIFDANQTMARARDNALWVYRSLGQLQTVTQRTFMPDDEKKAKLRLIEDVKKQIFAGTLKIKKAMDAIVSSGDSFQTAAGMASEIQ